MLYIGYNETVNHSVIFNRCLSCCLQVALQVRVNFADAYDVVVGGAWADCMSPTLGAAIARPLRLGIGLAIGLGIGIVPSYGAIAMG